jgi:hypothetical protein
VGFWKKPEETLLNFTSGFLPPPLGGGNWKLLILMILEMKPFGVVLILFSTTGEERGQRWVRPGLKDPVCLSYKLEPVIN